ncbi:MAG TPA: multidrug efflux RND transporter permease subunit [Burkholderiales bacterium]|nr:multidrug efflux RND transporter permease subunit [Burkholderiales bacterium]
MNPSEPFIRRPVATTLLTLGIALAGIMAFKALPVAPLPQVDFPTISVTAQLPGASPETMAATVAMPLERALGRIAGVTEITSSSSLGSTRITLQFELSRNIDGAARDVQGAINAAMSQLPSGLPNNPSYRKANPADAPIMILALTSNAYTQGQMYDTASTVLAQKISQIAGIGQVTVGGSSLPAVRVELNPNALNKYGISLDQVRAALNGANANRPKGSVELGDRSWQIYANDQAKKAAEYIPLIVAYRNGAAVRLSDVAEVVDSVQDVRNSGSSNGRPSVVLILYRQPGANIIETVDRVQELLPLLRASIPSAINLDVMLERTSTIRASLAEVERALMISMGLVILVVLVFLRSWRATLIPAVAVPVSLVGTFAVMWVAGFSINNLSLMALTVAAGFVVDDAIVVLENIQRRIDEGMPRMQAALAGAREVGFTVVSMTVSLIAVFIPILLMGGIVGRLFREFSVTLSVAVILSLVISLTTTPMMCARVLRPHVPEKTSRLARASGWAYDRMLRGYRATLGWSLRHPLLVMLVLAATIVLNIYLYVFVMPKGFFPQQDTGRLIGSVRADQGTSFQAMRQKVADAVALVKTDPAVENVVAFTGGAQRNRAFMFVTLKPLEVRKIGAEQVVARLRARTTNTPGVGLFLNQAADIRVGGRISDATYQFTLQADELDALQRWLPRLERALREVPEVADVNTDQEARGLQTTLTFDRETAARLGLTQRQIDSALNLAFGQAIVSTIYSELNQYRVVMEVAPQHWQSPEALSSVWLVSPKGQVPLSSIARWEMTNTPLSVNHQGQFVAATLSFNLPPGVSLSQATDAVRDTMARIGMPTSIGGTFQGTARTFLTSLESQPWLILAAIVTVYLVLGILYESLVHPITILSTLPSAGVGAQLALLLFGKDLDIIALIGVILLIGIVKKNAIMMIDVALDTERRLGKPPEEAIFEACLLRFRPIMMTTLAALLGALPLAVGYGYGAELRQPLGISIMGGLILSQLLTLYTTPVVYLYLDRFRLWCLRMRARRPAAAAAPTP